MRKCLLLVLFLSFPLRIVEATKNDPIYPTSWCTDFLDSKTLTALKGADTGTKGLLPFVFFKSNGRLKCTCTACGKTFVGGKEKEQRSTVALLCYHASLNSPHSTKTSWHLETFGENNLKMVSHTGTRSTSSSMFSYFSKAAPPSTTGISMAPARCCRRPAMDIVIL